MAAKKSVKRGALVTVRARKKPTRRKQDEVLARVAALESLTTASHERSFAKLVAIENRLIALETTIRPPRPVEAARREPQVVNRLEPAVDPIPVGADPARQNRVLAQPPTDYTPPPLPRAKTIDERRQEVGSCTPAETLERQGGWERVLLDLGWKKVPYATSGGAAAWLQPPIDKLQQNGRYVLGSAEQAARSAGVQNPYGAARAVTSRCADCALLVPHQSGERPPEDECKWTGKPHRWVLDQ
jgi:hypothetical protein